MNTDTKQPETLQAAVDALGLTYSASFVPFSRSRNAKANAKPNDFSLNWLVNISKGARTLTTDYMQGIAHIPGYKQETRWTVDAFEDLKHACETGTVKRGGFMSKPIPAPELRDVLYSLASDASVIDSGSFEEWASEYGYDTDSRTAEHTYRACLKTALELRAMIGEDGLAKLRAAAQDY